MPALDFPASPTVGQKYPSPAVTGVPVYTWDGEKWTTLGGAIGSTGASDAIPAEVAGTGAGGSSTLWSRGDHAHPATAPTPPPGDNDTSIATTAFVTAAVVNSAGTIPTTYVRYDQPQTLTAPQLIQARQNIYAAPFDAMAYGGMQINGGMEVSQEFGSVGTTTAGKYPCDGWIFGASASSVVGVSQANSGLSGIQNTLQLGVITAQPSIAAGGYFYVYSPIESYRTTRLAWGTASAQPLTISFWSAHHRSGVYGGCVFGAGNTRSYTFLYTQAAPDIWQYNIVTIPGDTTGAWVLGSAATGMNIGFVTAAGSTYIAPAANTWTGGLYLSAPGQINGVAATSDVFRITGVIVLPGNEAPSAARSPFIMRPYDQELAVCKRYFQWVPFSLEFNAPAANAGISTVVSLVGSMRAAPTMSALGIDPRTSPNISSNNKANSFSSPTTEYVSANLVATAAGDCFLLGYRSSADARL